MHVSFIMDGNGRWAEAQSRERGFGHEAGARALVRAISQLNELSLDCVSFYAFSTDNEKRQAKEVSGILGIIAYFLKTEIAPLVKELDLRFRVIGDLKRLPEKLADIICEINTLALNNKGMTVVLAIGYGGDTELCAAFDNLLRRREFIKDKSPLTVAELRGALYTASLPDPDMVIRYGGYRRLSNFMPLQTAYSELCFTDTLWPDFDIGEVAKFIEEFKTVKRNFGGLDV